MSLITDWKSCGEDCRYRIVGDMAEVIKLQREDPDTALLPFPSLAGFELDTSKTPHSMGVMGTSNIIGWPSWFPVFNRRRVYRWNFPVTKKGGSDE